MNQDCKWCFLGTTKGYLAGIEVSFKMVTEPCAYPLHLFIYLFIRLYFLCKAVFGVVHCGMSCINDVTILLLKV